MGKSVLVIMLLFDDKNIMNKKFLVTTPIYYPNGYPHIWHSYASFIADFYARYKRLLWYEVIFSTGNDENSQKILQKAQEEKRDVYEYLNEMAEKWKDVRDKLQISYTDFIRTTDEKHVKLVQEVLDATYKKWDIYAGEYEGYYCVWCEWFKKNSDLIEKDGKMVCPDHLTEPNILKEKNRFFKLKNYQQRLEDFYEKNPNFVEPGYRFNEVKSFVAGWLEDFSVSRESNKFWIPLPFDASQVSYVRYDALFNYVTVSKDKWFRDDDTEIVHILWKDISRFHAIFRPAMLMSVWYKIPDSELITWYFTVNWQKMSKSLWNVIDPVEVVDECGRDAVAFNLLYDVPIWSDWDFSKDRLRNVYESMIIWWWGNLVNRVTSLCAKYEIKEGKYNEKIWNKFISIDTKDALWNDQIFWKVNELYIIINEWFDVKLLELYLKKWEIQQYIKERYKLVQDANEYITKAEPRIKRKNEETKEEAKADLQFLLYIVKNLALLSAPVLVDGFKKIQEIFNNDELNKIDSSKNTSDSELFKKVFDMKEFKVNLNPQIIYKRIES